MTCEETRILVHALIDGELDAGHAHEVETHLASCPACAAQLRDYRVMRRSLAAPALRHEAPAALRARIEASLPVQPAPVLPARAAPAPSRRSLLKGMAMGSVLSGALAASLAVFLLRSQDDQRILGDVVSAHLRSLQGDRLIDVQSSDQHTVKPWFNGRRHQCRGAAGIRRQTRGGDPRRGVRACAGFRKIRSSGRPMPPRTTGKWISARSAGRTAAARRPRPCGSRGGAA
jgi:anti-sigma factor RsiW